MSSMTVTGLPSTPSRKLNRHPQARRPCAIPFNATARSYYRSPRISLSNWAFDASPMCLLQILPSRLMRSVVGSP